MDFPVESVVIFGKLVRKPAQTGYLAEQDIREFWRQFQKYLTVAVGENECTAVSDQLPHGILRFGPEDIAFGENLDPVPVSFPENLFCEGEVMRIGRAVIIFIDETDPEQIDFGFRRPVGVEKTEAQYGQRRRDSSSDIDTHHEASSSQNKAVYIDSPRFSVRLP